jgi:hypothetical protein
MGADTGSQDWRDRKVREWLLLLLRFAVTREPSDHAAVLAMADELDSLGARWRPSGPTFFLRTSTEVCETIIAVIDGHNHAVLRRHAARIDDLRLRRAFRAAVGFQPTQAPRPDSVKRKRRRTQDLWKGLPKR